MESISPHRAFVYDFLRDNKYFASAATASVASTVLGYPLDTLKAKLQTNKERTTIWKFVPKLYREEGGIRAFYKGMTIPTVTIAISRAVSFTVYSSTSDLFRKLHYFNRDTVFDVAVTGAAGGALAGMSTSILGAPWELVKIRRQLEYSIVTAKGLDPAISITNRQAFAEIIRAKGLFGLYAGFRIHLPRDVFGSALYFLENDAFRFLLGRPRSGEQRKTPSWLPIPSSLIPFVCGSVAGVTSWMVIYPLDTVKTKIQERALKNLPPRPVSEVFSRLLRGPDDQHRRSLLSGVTRMYSGLGVSAFRSILTHGLLWTFFDVVGRAIDGLPKT